MGVFFNDTATTEIYTLSLHDALPISGPEGLYFADADALVPILERIESADWKHIAVGAAMQQRAEERSEEHTSELQSRQYLVCRLLLEKKKNPLCHQFTLHSIAPTSSL